MGTLFSLWSLPFLTHGTDIVSSLPDSILSYLDHRTDGNVDLPYREGDLPTEAEDLLPQSYQKADLLIQDEFTSA